MFNPSLIIVQNSSQDPIRSILLDLVRKKLQNTVKKISATVHLTCFGPDGINAIKDVLSSALVYSKTIAENLQTSIASSLSVESIAPTISADSTTPTAPSTTLSTAPSTLSTSSVDSSAPTISSDASTFTDVTITNTSTSEPQPIDDKLVLNIYTLGCPEYSLNVETKNLEKGKEFLNLVIADIKSKMQMKNGGGFLLKREPFVLGEDN